jgi:hypothetical protein
MLYQINLLFLVVNIYPTGAKLTSDKSPSNAIFYTLYINEVQYFPMRDSTAVASSTMLAMRLMRKYSSRNA